LSVMITVPVRVPAAVGVKVTTIKQAPPGAVGLEAEQVVVGSSAKSPLRLMAVKVRLPVLVAALVRVTDSGVPVVPTACAPNDRLEGRRLRVTPVGFAAAPKPLRAMSWVPPLALSLMVTVPVRAVAAVGVKVTAMTQVASGASGLEGEQVVVGSSAKSPLRLSPRKVKVLVLVLVRVTDCTALVAPTAWLPKVRLEGVRTTPGAIPLPFRLTT